MVRSVRKRYIRFQLVCDGPPLLTKDLAFAIRKMLLSLYGEIVVADSRLFLTKYDEESCEGILECDSRVIDYVMTAMALLYLIDSTKVSVRFIRISGTIKGVQK